jgi:hypothetical protein
LQSEKISWILSWS